MDIHADYIIHAASNVSLNMIVTEPVETMLSNFLGMKYLLDYAREQRSKRVLSVLVKCMVKRNYLHLIVKDSMVILIY